MIRARALTLTYPEAPRPALDGLDLDLAPGQVLGVVGPMGAGKTSLCMTLAGLVPRGTGGEATGELEVAGLDPREATIPDIAGRIGLVFEDYASQLTQITVLAEVTAPLVNPGTPVPQARETARRLLADLGLAHLDGEHKRTWELSGGQQQRVAIAAALATEPDLLMLDNVTGMLDPAGKQEVHRLALDLAEHTTLVVVEDDVEILVGVADQLLVLRDGVAAAHGPATTLLRDAALFDTARVDPPIVVQVARAADLRSDPLTVGELAAASRVAGQTDDKPDLPTGSPADPATVNGSRGESGHGGSGELSPTELSRAEGVEVRDVCFRYPDGTAAVDDVTLRVLSGQVHAVVGGNGAGKSTLLRMLCGLARPSSGQIHVGGLNTREHTPAELARAVGTALQNPDEPITERTVRAEIAHPLRLRRHRRRGWFGKEVVISDEEIADEVERCRRLVGLGEEILDADPTHLSRGHRKLVTIAGALALDPAVLVLDEPRVSLDAPARSALRHLLHQLRERRTAVVIVEHDLDLVAETADTVTLLDAGRVTAAGSPRDVFGPGKADVLAHTSLLPPRAAQIAAELGVEAFTVAELAAELYPVTQEA